MKREIVVIGGSAGAIQALRTVLPALPHDLNAAVFIVIHLRPDAQSHLVETLQRASQLPVANAEDRHQLQVGHIYVAPPDQHLVLDKQHIRLTRGPRENRSRPSVDALFRSAAYEFGEGVIGLILSGSLDDGTAGLWSIKERGGTAIVQDPADAEHDGMPRSALQNVKVDHVCAAKAIAPLLARLVKTPVDRKRTSVSREMEIETQIAKEGKALQLGLMSLGPVTPYTCPECHGVLVAIKQGGVPRFRCHTGHAYSINNLLADVTGHVEESLWATLRAIEESMMLLQEAAQHVGANGSPDLALSTLLQEKADDTKRRADLVRQALMSHQTLSLDNIVAARPRSEPPADNDR